MTLWLLGFWALLFSKLLLVSKGDSRGSAREATQKEQSQEGRKERKETTKGRKAARKVRSRTEGDSVPQFFAVLINEQDL